MRGHGFTLVELVLVILLIAIVGATARPMFSGQRLFSEKFFSDDAQTMLRYASLVARNTGCDVQIQHIHDQLGLYQRAQCTIGAFTLPLASPSLLDSGQYALPVPKSVILRGAFPVTIGKGGQLRDLRDDKLQSFSLTIGGRQIIMSGANGFVYEKSQ